MVCVRAENGLLPCAVAVEVCMQRLALLCCCQLWLGTGALCALCAVAIQMSVF